MIEKLLLRVAAGLDRIVWGPLHDDARYDKLARAATAIRAHNMASEEYIAQLELLLVRAVREMRDKKAAEAIRADREMAARERVATYLRERERGGAS